jgi:hypothetical protein
LHSLVWRKQFTDLVRLGCPGFIHAVIGASTLVAVIRRTRTFPRHFLPHMIRVANARPKVIVPANAPKPATILTAP